MKVGIIGGGAAGFFAAISAKEHHPQAEVVILEKGAKALAKVAITGGGRCNVTHHCESVEELCTAFPRGGRKLKKLFHRFNNFHTERWFTSRGVPLVTQEDGCLFPRSQDSASIIDALLLAAQQLGVQLRCGATVQRLAPVPEGWQVYLRDAEEAPLQFQKLVVATGGSPTPKGMEWIAQLGQPVVAPVPSLFTFNMPDEPVRELMGIVVEQATASIQGTKLRAEGPLLITHWGMSGPAVLKLSAFGARLLADMGYQCTVQINWLSQPNTDLIVALLNELAAQHPQKLVHNLHPPQIPARLWSHLLNRAEIAAERRWAELGRKGLNRLANQLANDSYRVRGKSVYKEEFVTSGGVALDQIDLQTLQSKLLPGLYFAGEAMDIDAITGGYNLQGAWTTGFVAGQLG